MMSYYQATLESRDRETPCSADDNDYRRWAHECDEVQVAFEMHQRSLVTYRKPLELYRWLAYR